MKRGLTPRQPAAVQGGTPKGNVALRQLQRQPPLDNQLGVFLCLQKSYLFEVTKSLYPTIALNGNQG